jgi:glycine hydroxymethyltransferase
MELLAGWLDRAITAAIKADEQALAAIAAQVRELLAGFPMPGWGGPA